MKNYVEYIRSRVGNDKVILTFAGGCVINENGEVLLQKRTDFDAWGFPGGAIEFGETPEMTAIREIKEETGLNAEIIELIGVYTEFDMTYPNGDKAQSICIAYKLKAVGGEIISENIETKELRWFSLNDMPRLFCKQHEKVLNDLKNL